MEYPVTIRRLKGDDVGAVYRLLSMFGREFNEPESYCDSQPGTHYLERILAGDSIILLAAEDDDRVIGGLAAYLLEKFEQERSEFFIYDLAVAEAYRRRGVASALIEEGRRVARELGAYAAFIQADRDNAPAVKLYSKLGTPEDMLHFEIDVQDDD